MRSKLLQITGTAFLCLITWTSIAQEEKPNNTLQMFLERWKEDVIFRNAGISVYVYDLNRHSAVAYESPRLSLVPASTMKVVTTASALEILGSGYRFKTRIQYTGEIDSNGVLNGNIYIKGGGDPSLGSGYYKSYNADYLEKWVKAVKDAGIKSINGQIIADASIFGENTIPAHWSWGDIGNYYGAPACGLTIHDNKTVLQFRSGPNAGDSTWVDCMVPYVPEMRVYNKVRAANTKSDNAYIYGGLYDPVRIAEGTIPKGEEVFEVKASIPDPPYLAALELESALNEAGVEAKYACSTVRRLRFMNAYRDTLERQTLHTLNGASVGNLCYWTNHVSVNLFAEHLLKGVGVRKAGDGSTYSSTRAIQKYWSGRGVDMTGFYMTDGSGLSRGNAISARHLVFILKHMSGSKYADTFKKSLSVAGKSGTLRRIGRGTKAANNLMGKSGSMTRVRSYCGYVTSASGRQLAFAIIVNNYNGTSSQIRDRLNKLMVAMANFSG